jgi:hypothetical protein
MRCGAFGWPHCGQRFTRGASSRCVARRLSRRDFDVFLFGTAMSARTVADVRGLLVFAVVMPLIGCEAAEAFDAVGDASRATLARLPLAVLRAFGGDTVIAELEKTQRVLEEGGDDWGTLLATNGLCWY